MMTKKKVHQKCQIFDPQTRLGIIILWLLMLGSINFFSSLLLGIGQTNLVLMNKEFDDPKRLRKRCVLMVRKSNPKPRIFFGFTNQQPRLGICLHLADN